jgi:hypothetical protein
MGDFLPPATLKVIAEDYQQGLLDPYQPLTSIEPMTPSDWPVSRRILPLFASYCIASAQHEVVRLLQVAQLRAGGGTYVRHSPRCGR